MSETPIKRGTARRLGLDLPPPDLVMRLEFDLGALGRRIADMRAAPPIDWGGISIAAHIAQERRMLAIRAICPPRQLTAATSEAAKRGWTHERLYHELAAGWLPPVVG